MIAPVLVPATKSKWSERTSLGEPVCLRSISCMCKRISRLNTPRIPPPSRQSIRFMASLVGNTQIPDERSPFNHLSQQGTLHFRSDPQQNWPCTRQFELFIPRFQQIVQRSKSLAPPLPVVDDKHGAGNRRNLKEYNRGKGDYMLPVARQR